MNALNAVEKEYEERDADYPGQRRLGSVPPRGAGGRFSHIEKWLDVAPEIIRQVDFGKRSKCLPAKRSKQYRERRKVFGKPFRPKLSRQQDRYEHQEERRPFGQFSGPRDKKYVA